MGKRFITRVEYSLRDLRSKRMYAALQKYSTGDVLDVGGWDFFLTAKKKKIRFNTWVALEYDTSHFLRLCEERFKYVCGDGCNIAFKDETFDTILNIQVLEHVFEPIKMIDECARVLKQGGHGIFVIPQTSVIHFFDMQSLFKS